MSLSFQPTANIKLVIWDLDETFWDGTLSEGGIRLIESNLAMVRTLADRGILSSIVSKNDREPVEAVLTQAGIWDHFVFPKISWNSKGSQIADILKQANLRPDNALFIDDNAINIEEARFRFPTMMIAYPHDVLPVLLSLPEAKGKNDREHSRLTQYKQLERKVVEQVESGLDNVEFLRQSDIRLRFDFDIEGNFDRIVELINRSNQLNYTKKRLETEEALDEFREQMNRHDTFAAAIFASDRYGTHGLIGFYMQQRNERANRLVHYVWSCRMMNAGLEQYVYERLNKPELDVVEPVSNPISVFDVVDWVGEQSGGEDADAGVAKATQLLLLGSCDLTAVASYCSANRREYVNGVKHGIMTRYDDFGFLLGDADAIAASRVLPMLPAWDAAAFAAFDTALSESEIVIVSLFAALKGHHLVTGDGVVVRIHPEGLGHAIDSDPGAAWLADTAFYDITIERKLDLLARSIDRIDRGSPAARHKFLLGANTRDGQKPMRAEDRVLAEGYNAACEALCADRPDWVFVSIDAIITRDKLMDDRHYTRIGYLDIANHLNERIAAAQRKPTSSADPTPGSDRRLSKDPWSLAQFVSQSRKLSRLAIFGNRPKTHFAPIKQAVKLMPFSRILRRKTA